MLLVVGEVKNYIWQLTIANGIAQLSNIYNQKRINSMQNQLFTSKFVTFILAETSYLSFSADSLNCFNSASSPSVKLASFCSSSMLNNIDPDIAPKSE